MEWKELGVGGGRAGGASWEGSQVISKMFLGKSGEIHSLKLHSCSKPGKTNLCYWKSGQGERSGVALGCQKCALQCSGGGSTVGPFCDNS